jgi:hypothetical protein
VWDQILADGGSIQGLDFLDEWCFVDGKVIQSSEVKDDEVFKMSFVKEVFKTFKEIGRAHV